LATEDEDDDAIADDGVKSALWTAGEIRFERHILIA